MIMLRDSACVCVCVIRWWLTLCDPRDCSSPGSSVHGILQARILEKVASPFSRGSSQTRNQTRVSCITGSFFFFFLRTQFRRLKIQKAARRWLSHIRRVLWYWRLSNKERIRIILTGWWVHGSVHFVIILCLTVPVIFKSLKVYVHPWQIQVNVWQNQYNTVK